MELEDSEETEGALEKLEDYKAQFTLFLETDEAWSHLFESPNFSFAQVFFKTIDLSPNLAIRLWKEAKFYNEKAFLEFLESIGAEFQVVLIHGKEYFSIIRNKKILVGQPLQSLMRTPKGPENLDFFEFLHQKGVSRDFEDRSPVQEKGHGPEPSSPPPFEDDSKTGQE